MLGDSGRGEDENLGARTRREDGSLKVLGDLLDLRLKGSEELLLSVKEGGFLCSGLVAQFSS